MRKQLAKLASKLANLEEDKTVNPKKRFGLFG
jgi:hypothetical protein